MPTIEDFIATLRPQAGKPYKFGFEVDLSDPDPPAFDCSEIMEWASYQIGLTPPLPDGSWTQCQRVRDAGLLMQPANAVNTRGALLFKFSSDPFTGNRPTQAHVALSLGSGRSFEARSTELGVGEFSSLGRGWTHAGLIPGLVYPTPQPPPDEPSALPVWVLPALYYVLKIGKVFR